MTDGAKVPPAAEAAVEAAKTDLAKRLTTPADDITVVGVEEAEWSDSSLGCPKPGFMYAQVITPGYRIRLSVANKDYEYHSDRGRNVVLC